MVADNPWEPARLGVATIGVGAVVGVNYATRSRVLTIAAGLLGAGLLESARRSGMPSQAVLDLRNGLLVGAGMATAKLVLDDLPLVPAGGFRGISR